MNIVSSSAVTSTEMCPGVCPNVSMYGDPGKNHRRSVDHLHQAHASRGSIRQPTLAAVPSQYANSEACMYQRAFGKNGDPVDDVPSDVVVVEVSVDDGDHLAAGLSRGGAVASGILPQAAAPRLDSGCGPLPVSTIDVAVRPGDQIAAIAHTDLVVDQQLGSAQKSRSDPGNMASGSRSAQPSSIANTRNGPV